ncbi:MFS transporter [soil metagenome]
MPTTSLAPVAPSSWQLSPPAAFALQASITIAFLAGSIAPTPLYPIYQAEWGFSSTLLTMVFGVYALAVLMALLVAGRLSDFIGRRPVLIAAAAVQALTMLLFVTADGLSDLMVARVLQGLATGASMGAVGAGLLDIDRARGTLANAVVPMAGTASGGLIAGFMVQYLPAPTQLVYLLLGGVFVIQGVAVIFIAETAQTRAGALRSLIPQVGVPPAVRGAMLAAIPALVACWSLAGFYGALGPVLTRALTGSSSALLGGGIVFLMIGSGAVAVVLMRAMAPRTLTIGGSIAVLAGMSISLPSLWLHSLAGFLLATLVIGVGMGLLFQGAVRSVVVLSAPHERAGVLSVVFVVSYMAMGGPAVAAGGWLSVKGDMIGTAEGFGVGVMALALLALVGAVRARRAD